MKRLSALAFGGALFAACGPKLTSPATILGRTDPAAVHVSGQVFRDGTGRQLLFRGYNAKVNGIFDAQFSDGRAPNETFPDFDEASAEKFEELGFDAMRLTINWSALEPTPLHYSDAFFAKVDVVLDMAHRHHFYVILDMHQDAYSKEIGEDGAPLWAITPEPASSKSSTAPAMIAVARPRSSSKRASISSPTRKRATDERCKMRSSPRSRRSRNVTRMTQRSSDSKRSTSRSFSIKTSSTRSTHASRTRST